MSTRSELAMALGMCSLLTACGGGGNSGGGPTISSVTVSPATVDVITGATQQFTATVNGTGSFSSQVAWSVNGIAGGNSTYGTVATGGLYTAPGIPPSPNVVTVSAASSADAAVSGSSKASVLNPAPTLSAISPASIGEGSAPLVISINGSGFDQLSAVAVAGSARTTTFVDGTHLDVQLSASDLAAPASLSVVVSNPAPGGGTSASLEFAVLSVPGGKTGPSFTAARDATVGGEGCCITVADFNEDGIPDVATVHATYDINNPAPRDQMYVQFGDGNGNFRSRSIFTTGSGPIALVAGDFNHDGHMDLVSANTPIIGVSGPSTISIFLGDGKGNFTRNDEILSGTPDSIAAGDFNNDGNLDLAIGMAVPGAGNTTLILLGKGDGTFQPGTTLPAPGGDGVAVGDFNEDGKLDLFTCFVVQNQCLLYPGNGDGTFASPKTVNANMGIAGPFAVADVDGDGHLDVVAGPSVPGPTTYVLWGDGKGDFTVQTIATAPNLGVAIGDIDGDGRKDIVLGSAGFTSGILYQKSPRTFAFDNSVQDIGDTLAVADLNRDGFADVLSYRQGNIRSYLSSGANGLIHSHITWFQNAKVAALGDFNSDGKLDVAVATDSAVTILAGDGTGQFTLGTPFGSFNGKIWGIASGDFTGDGILDLAVGADDLVIYRGDGKGNFTEFSRVPQVTPGYSGAIGTLLAADVNGDGKLDLVVASYSTPNISVLLGDGTGHFTIGGQITLSGDSIGVAAGDFNEDGFTDLAITDFALNTNLIRPFFGSRTGALTAGPTAAAGLMPYSVAVADFDKDGHLDLVVADFYSTLLTIPGTSTLLFGDGHGAFPRSMTLQTGNQSNSVAVADIDGDGWPDIVLMNNGNSDFDVFINDRKGSFLPPYPFAVGTSPMTFAIGDVDGDGRPDVVSVIVNGIEVTLNRTTK